METYTLQPDASGNDCYMQANQATTAHDNTNIYVGYASTIHRGLLKFDLSSFSANPDYITSAYVEFTSGMPSTTRTLALYPCLKNWNESATWNKYDGTNNWNTAGAWSASDVNQTAVGSIELTSGGSSPYQVNLDVAHIKDWIKGTTNNYGWLLKFTTETTTVIAIKSSDDATESNRPKLVIAYTVGGAGNNMTIIGV